MWKIWGWKRLLRSSNPTINSSLPCPLNHAHCASLSIWNGSYGIDAELNHLILFFLLDSLIFLWFFFYFFFLSWSGSSVQTRLFSSLQEVDMCMPCSSYKENPWYTLYTHRAKILQILKCFNDKRVHCRIFAGLLSSVLFGLSVWRKFRRWITDM